MDEYRGQYGNYYREQGGHSSAAHHTGGHESHNASHGGHHGGQEEMPHHHHHHAEGHVVETGGGGILHSFGLGAFEEYLPMVLIGLGILGVYLWLQKDEGGIGGIFGRFL